MSAHISYSFSDPTAGLHCYGTGDQALALREGSSGVHAGSLERDGGEGSFAVAIDGVCAARLEPLGPAIGDGSQDWICRLTGTNAAGAPLSGFGAVSTGVEGLGGQVLRRSIWICFGGDLAVTLTAQRRRRRHGHGDEAVAAFIARGTPLAATVLEEPLLSSTYRADGQLLRAGLELWEDDGEESVTRERTRALRIAGETVAAGELAGQGGVQTSVAFLVWHYDGLDGLGCYAIERAAG